MSESRLENIKISVATDAKLLGASERFVGIGLQQKGILFGYAVKTSGQYTYVIIKQKFEEATGIKVA